MRSRLLIIACVIAVSLQLSGQEKSFKVGEITPLPKDGFANFKELQKWASNSSFGGGRSGMFNLGGEKIFFTDRCFTSGMSTSEVTFYTQRVDGRIGRFFALPMELREHRIEQRGDKIIITTYNEASKAWLEIMSISSAMFTASPFNIEQVSADQPATASELKSEGEKKTKPEPEVRPQ